VQAEAGGGRFPRISAKSVRASTSAAEEEAETAAEADEDAKEGGGDASPTMRPRCASNPVDGGAAAAHTNELHIAAWLRLRRAEEQGRPPSGSNESGGTLPAVTPHSSILGGRGTGAGAAGRRSSLTPKYEYAMSAFDREFTAATVIQRAFRAHRQALTTMSGEELCRRVRRHRSKCGAVARMMRAHGITGAVADFLTAITSKGKTRFSDTATEQSVAAALEALQPLPPPPLPPPPPDFATMTPLEKVRWVSRSMLTHGQPVGGSSGGKYSGSGHKAGKAAGGKARKKVGFGKQGAEAGWGSGAELLQHLLMHDLQAEAGGGRFPHISAKSVRASTSTAEEEAETAEAGEEAKEGGGHASPTMRLLRCASNPVGGGAGTAQGPLPATLMARAAASRRCYLLGQPDAQPGGGGTLQRPRQRPPATSTAASTATSTATSSDLDSDGDGEDASDADTDIDGDVDSQEGAEEGADDDDDSEDDDSDSQEAPHDTATAVATSPQPAVATRGRNRASTHRKDKALIAEIAPRDKGKGNKNQVSTTRVSNCIKNQANNVKADVEPVTTPNKAAA
jgi:hypothetical protein